MLVAAATDSTNGPTHDDFAFALGQRINVDATAFPSYTDRVANATHLPHENSYLPFTSRRVRIA